MIPRVELKARELLRTQTLTKMELSETAFCHMRTAQKVLSKLHRLGVCKIAAWVRQHNYFVPVYGDIAEDMPKPRPMTSAERAKKSRQNYMNRLKQAYRKRQKRYLDKITSRKGSAE